MQGLLAKRSLVLVLVALVTAAAHANLDTRTPPQAGNLRVPSPEVAELLALGFEPVLADYYWLQALQLVGGARGPLGERADSVGDLIDVVTTLDPHVDHPYRFAALWLNESPEQVVRGNELLRRGIERHPDEWRNRFYLGFNQFFYQDQSAAAADTLAPAVGLPGAPAYLGALVARLRAERGGLEVASAFLLERQRDTKDEVLRAAYQDSLAEIETERRARWLDAARARFREQHGRDIRTPEDLWIGPLRVIDGARAAHPEHDDARWVLDTEASEIVSSHYGKRYRLHVQAPQDEGRRRRQALDPQQVKDEG